MECCKKISVPGNRWNDNGVAGKEVMNDAVLYYEGGSRLRFAPVGAEQASTGRLAPLATTKKPV